MCAEAERVCETEPPLSFLARVYAHGDDDDDDDDPAYVDACEYIHLPVTGRSLKA